MGRDMNLYDLNTNTITMNIDGKDIEMKPAICFGKVHDNWLVSRCGKVWSTTFNRLKTGGISKGYITHTITVPEEDWWGDGSGWPHIVYRRNGASYCTWERSIGAHKMIIDTYQPLYDNPPEGIIWEQWEIARELDTVYDHISKAVVIDHIDNIRHNNHLDNLRRVTQWDNNFSRKAKGI